MHFYNLLQCILMLLVLSWMLITYESISLVLYCVHVHVDLFSRYSCTEGEKWEDLQFTTEPIHVDGVLDEPGITTLIVR